MRPAPLTARGIPPHLRRRQRRDCLAGGGQLLVPFLVLAPLDGRHLGARPRPGAGHPQDLAAPPAAPEAPGTAVVPDPDRRDQRRGRPPGPRPRQPRLGLRAPRLCPRVRPGDLGQQLYYLKGGYDPVFERFSPGMALLSSVIDHAFGNHIERVELLGGDERYKLAFTSDVKDKQRFQAFAPSPLGLLSRTAFQYGRPAARRALDLAR